jgi:hypothetical protein
MKPMPKNPPSIKNHKPKTSTPVKHYPGLGYAPKIAKVDKKAFKSNFS